MDWTIEIVKEKLLEIEAKGFIPIPSGTFRTDDGIVGQVLEREFGVAENNLHMADLGGTYELKGMRQRKNKSNLTLFHQTSSSGLNPINIFDRFGYHRKSNRSDVMMKKLFTTIKGNRTNSLGFILKALNEDDIGLYYNDEYLATWDLTDAKQKISQVILALAETQGAANSKTEKYHYNEVYLLSGVKNISEAISKGSVVMDLCIDQPAGGSKAPHDRGPHIRIPVKKLGDLFESVTRIL